MEPIFPQEPDDKRQYVLALKTLGKNYYKGSPIEVSTKKMLKRYRKEYVVEKYEPVYIIVAMSAASLIDGKFKIQYRWEF